MTATAPLVTQTALCLVVFGFMLLAGIRLRRLELRSAPIRRFRWREWRRAHRR